MRWINLVIFLLFSTALLIFTLRRPHSHRGYRYLAFECVLALIFLQADSWFVKPFIPLQILSWTLLGSSLFLALHGFRLLSTIGAPDQDLENTTQLVTDGAYHFIRHPLYASLLLFGIGAVLKDISLLSLTLLIGLLIAVYATGRVEEHSNLNRFGEAYRIYMQQTKMFIPFLF